MASKPNLASELEAELKNKKVIELRRRALSDGVSSDEVEAADDEDDTKQALIKLILAATAKKKDVASEPPQHTMPPSPRPASELEAELKDKRVGELRKRALADGVPSENIEAADDEDDTKHALIMLILAADAKKQDVVPKSKFRAGVRAAELEAELTADLEAELKNQKVSELRRRALADGVPPEEIEAADDEDDTKQALINLLSPLQAKKAIRAELEGKLAAELEAELKSKKVSDLRRRALNDGVSPEEVEAADDEDDTKQALIKLVLVANAKKKDSISKSKFAELKGLASAKRDVDSELETDLTNKKVKLFN